MGKEDQSPSNQGTLVYLVTLAPLLNQVLYHAASAGSKWQNSFALVCSHDAIVCSADCRWHMTVCASVVIHSCLRYIKSLANPCLEICFGVVNPHRSTTWRRSRQVADRTFGSHTTVSGSSRLTGEAAM